MLRKTITTRVASTAAAVMAAGVLGLAGAQQASAAQGPNMQLPFPCGEVWVGNNSNSSAHRTSYEYDFNLPGGREDRGWKIVAPADATVVTSRHQGSANGFGNLIVLDHGNHRTYYAHLSSLDVREGQRVSQGQFIGRVGNTSRPGNNISPHLHFEVRREGASYPGSIVQPVFDGVPYRGGSITSRNCGGGSTPAPPSDDKPFPGRDAFKLGQSHPAVVDLDNALIRKGFARHHDGNGYQPGPVFSTYTRDNVRDFQRAQGWSGADADGYPGPETWRRLMQ